MNLPLGLSIFGDLRGNSKSFERRRRPDRIGLTGIRGGGVHAESSGGCASGDREEEFADVARPNPRRAGQRRQCELRDAHRSARRNGMRGGRSKGARRKTGGGVAGVDRRDRRRNGRISDRQRYAKAGGDVRCRPASTKPRRQFSTTDTRAKTAFAEVKGARIAGMTKGSGMIQPRMATTLGFVMTDAAISPSDLRAMLKRAIAKSYNRISVDGDTSTNDTVALLANGASRAEDFAQGLRSSVDRSSGIAGACRSSAMAKARKS